MGSRSNSIDMEPGPSRGHQSVARASFGSVASSVSYLSYGNEAQPGSSRGMFGPPHNNIQMFQPAEQGPPSPTGSEVLAAGPSRAMEQIDLHDSPSSDGEGCFAVGKANCCETLGGSWSQGTSCFHTWEPRHVVYLANMHFVYCYYCGVSCG